MSSNLFKSEMWLLLKRSGFLPAFKILINNHNEKKKYNPNIKESKMVRKTFTKRYINSKDNRSPYHNSFYRIEPILNKNGLIISVKRGKYITLTEKGVKVWNKLLELKEIFDS